MLATSWRWIYGSLSALCMKGPHSIDGFSYQILGSWVPEISREK